MFRKLRGHIVRSVIIVALIFAATVTLVSFGMISNILYNKHSGIAAERLSRGIKNSRYYLESVQNSCITLTDNEALPLMLQNNNAASITSSLDYFTTYALTINGAVIYNLNGSSYASSRVAAVPTLSDLENDRGINQFMESDRVDYWSFRKNNIIKIYNNLVYPSDYGIITYCRKIYDSGGALAGYLFADIIPEVLYTRYLDFSYTGVFDNAYTFISGDYGYFTYGKNAESAKYLTEDKPDKIKVSRDLRYLIINEGFMDNSEVTLLIDLKGLYTNLILILSAFLLADIALIFAAYLISKKLANNVTIKLDRLLGKMSHTENALLNSVTD